MDRFNYTATMNSQYEIIKKAIEYIEENYEYQPCIEQIAQHVGLSQYHFARLFKTYAGVTPMQFLKATTLQHAKRMLQESKSVLETTIDLGLSSSSRLHELFVNFEAVTPHEYKALGKSLTITYGTALTPFGEALIAMTQKGVCALEFYDDNPDSTIDALKQRWVKATFQRDDDKAFEMVQKIFLKNEKVSLFVKGTNFQIQVWKALLNIPKGKLISYSHMAQVLEKPTATRAIATAIASNHIALLIPCHRVISKSAAMGGYRWGVARKKIILARENLFNNENRYF